MFPAPVGMNRFAFAAGLLPHDVPRACGDEPLLDFAEGEVIQCSPRLWG